MSLDANDLPQTFGRYTLLRRIAVGGMAEVYVAKTAGVAGFEKLVALKVIHPRLSEDAHFTQMLVEEAKIAVLLNHVNIAQTFDLGKVDDTYYIEMELIEGADAYRVMRRCAELRKAIPIDVAAFVVSEVCNGLDYAHRKRDPNTGQPLHIVHRDISPQNVLISFAGEVKIVDFGIAKAASRSTQTEVGVIKGKYYYMSPEQAWGDPMDHRSDVFSTGVVLYELLTGRMLYQDVDVPVLLDKVRKADIARPETRRPSIPRALSDIVMKALAKRPEDRFASAGEMGQALHQFLYSVSPAFSAARVAELVALLFPTEAPRSGSTKLPAIESLPPPPPPEPPAKASFDLGDDDEGDATRNDVLPYRRARAAAGAPPPAADPPPRPVGRAGETREIDSQDMRVSAPQVGPGGAWVAPVSSDPGVARREVTTDARSAPTGDWEDETDLRDGRDEFEDSTLVDSKLGSAVARALEPSTKQQVVVSPRGKVQVVTGTKELPAKSAFAFDHEDTTNELQRARAQMLVPRPAAAPAPLPKAKLSNRPLPARPQAMPRPMVAPPRVAPVAVAAPVNANTTQPLPLVSPAAIPLILPAKGAQAPPGSVASTHPSTPSHPGASAPQAHPSPGYGAHGYGAYAPQPYAQSARAAHVHAPQAQPATQPRHGPPPSGFAPFQGGPAQGGPAQGGPAQGGPAQGHGATMDPFAPPSTVTSGLAALESPRPLPWGLVAAALLLLAVAAGVGVFFLVPSAPPPAFEIASLPSGATVVVDGRPLPGVTPVSIREGLEVGRVYAVQVSLDGHETSSFQLQAGPGTMRREVVLSPRMATLRIETEPPGAQVTVSGASRGASPVTVGGLFVGAEVEVRVDAPGFGSRVERVRVTTAPETATRIALTPVR